MRVAIYTRVSTGEQNIDTQINTLVDYAARKEWSIAGVFTETASAWNKGNQRELNKLLVTYGREIDAILVFALDRLTRGGAGPILQTINSLKSMNVSVISYREPWTQAPGEFQELLIAVAGWAAQMESNNISARTRAGLARARAAGVKLGRPAGAKDKKPRKKRGYLKRQENEANMRTFRRSK